MNQPARLAQSKWTNCCMARAMRRIRFASGGRHFDTTYEGVIPNLERRHEQRAFLLGAT